MNRIIEGYIFDILMNCHGSAGGSIPNRKLFINKPFSEEPGKRQIQKEAEYVNKIAARQSGQKAETQNQGTDKDQDISQG